MTGRAVYLGSFTNGESGRGITLTRQDPATGALSGAELVAEASSPGFLAWHPDGQHLYAVSETASGSVSAFAVADDGKLRELGNQPTGGQGPCHLSVHPSGRYVLAANYGSGGVSVLPIDATGNLGERTDYVQHEGSGPVPSRQAGPHAHQVRIDPSGHWVLVADLGIDAVLIYTLDLDTGRLRPGPVPAARTTPGSGPRHLVFGANGYVYVAGELDSSVLVLSLDATTGALDQVGSAPSIVGEPGEGNYPSEIALSEDGRYCYVANRGRDVITTLAVDGATLRPVSDVPTGGAWPRHIAVIGEYLYVANQHSDDVTQFRLSPQSGVPEPSAEPLRTPTPSCVLAAPLA